MRSIQSILIANRGEIVSRIIRTCTKMGIRSIVVYSDADRSAPFVREADEAMHIGGSSPSESYLDQDKIIAAALQAGADAIHPGFGFLAENAGFAQACAKAELIFIGPNPAAIEAMGSKSKAKSLMRQHSVPVIPGYQGEDQSEETLSAAAKDIGYPVLLKAAAGGGGKGMRIVNYPSEMSTGIAAAKREALSAFGNDELILEKYFPSSRHIEFQIFGDQHGHALHLLERECSIQRRYQKIIEESPSPAIDDQLRAKMGEAAVKAAEALSYDNAGTVEFLLAQNGDFFFLEVNTRLQVEHPVTEAITGLDLVQMQIEVAEGRPLSLSQEEVKGQGYAIECRLYAEDPENDFLPDTGTILNWSIPLVDGLRVDSGIETHSDISVFYDPMIAKIICHGKDRSSTLRKMLRTLQTLTCQGLKTNQNLLQSILENRSFQSGEYDTHFLKDEFYKEDLAKKQEELIPLACIAATVTAWKKREDKRSILHHIPSGWRNNFSLFQEDTYSFKEETINTKYRFLNNSFQIKLDFKEYEIQFRSLINFELEIDISEAGKTPRTRRFSVVESKNKVFVQSPGLGDIILNRLPRFPEKEPEKPSGSYLSPMPSEVLEVLVKEGQAIKAGDSLLILASMKMENTVAAWEDGIVEEVLVTAGEKIEAGIEMIRMQEQPET